MITVTALSQYSENNCGLVQLTITGTNFVAESATSCYLSSGLYGLIPASFFQVVSDTKAYADFELNGVNVSTYDVVVQGATQGSIAGFNVTDSKTYCTLADVKNFCHIDREDSNNNAQINVVLNKAGELIDKKTRRFFNARPMIEVLDDESTQVSGNKIFTKAFPIISVTSLIIDAVSQVENTDFWVYESFIKTDDVLITDEKGIELEYIAGFTTIPEDIHQICIEMASILCNLKTVTYTTADGIDKAVILTEFPAYCEERLKSYLKVNLR